VCLRQQHLLGRAAISLILLRAHQRAEGTKCDVTPSNFSGLAEKGAYARLGEGP